MKNKNIIISFILIISILLSSIVSCIPAGAEHAHDTDTNSTQNMSSATVLRGDIDGDGKVGIDDAIYLLRHTLLSNKYPISQSGDMNRDGKTDIDDAIYLLRHSLLPDKYPLTDKSETLDFKLSEDETYYIVTGMGEYKDTFLQIPDTYLDLPVKEIGDSAFKGTNLVTVIIPDSVTHIGNSAFEDCENLTKVELPENLEVIGDNAFKNTGIVEIIIPDKVKEIGDGAFEGCDELVKAEIPEDIEKIGDNAFKDCPKLEDVKIPDNDDVEIGDDAFNGTGAECKEHTLVHSPAVDPTCTADGITEGIRCSVCATVIRKAQVIPAIGHNVVIKNEVKATCVTDGYKEKYCSSCNLTFRSDIVYASGHSYSEFVTDKQETCESDGSKTRTCKVCSAVDTVVIPATEHVYVAVTDKNGDTVYQCEECLEIKNEESTEDIEDSDFVSDCTPDYSFIVVSPKGEDYIRENIKIINTMLEGTEYENFPGTVPEIIIEKIGEDTYRISPETDYESGVTYRVELNGEVEFQDHSGKTLNIIIASNGNMGIEFSDNIIFIKLPDALSPERNKYSIVYSEQTDTLRFTMPDAGVFSEEYIGRLVCVGDYTSMDELYADPSKQCDFGKISEVYYNTDGSFVMILTCPELYEIYDNLDINQTVDLEITDEDLPEDIEERAIAALLDSEDFAEFLASAEKSARSYAAERNLVLAAADTRSLLDGLKFDPDISVKGNKIKVKVAGSLTVPLQTESGKKYGSIVLKFSTNTELSYEVISVLQYKTFWGIPTKLLNVDIAVNQNSKFDFEFSLELKLEYSLSEREVEDIYLSASGLYHLKDCTQLWMYDVEKNLPAYSFEEADDLYRTSWGYIVNKECKTCRPFSKYMQENVFSVNTSTKTVHRFCCTAGDRFASANSDAKKELPSADTHKYCAVCQPQKAPIADLEQKILSELEYKNWGDKVSEIRKILNEKKVDKAKQSGFNVLNVPVPVAYILTIGLRIDVVLEFKFEGTISYKYSYETVDRYGIHYTGSSIAPYHQKEQATSKKEWQLMGKATFKAGVSVEFYASLLGLYDFANLSVGAEIGAYADLVGILKYIETEKTDNTGETEKTSDFISAAYFETGIYLDLYFEYKFLAWKNKTSFFGSEKRFPLIAIGYDKVYYSIAGNDDVIEIDGKTVDLSQHQILNANKFSVKDLKSETELLNVLGVKGKYSVTITVTDENGEPLPYCSVSDGKITVTDGAPCNFDATVTFTITGTDDAFDSVVEFWDKFWDKDFKAGSSKYTIKPYSVKINFENHTLSDWTVQTPPTCTETGIETRYYTCDCRDENGNYIYEYQDIPALGHKKVVDPAVQVSCTVDGYTEGSHCERCEFVFVAQQLIPMWGHKYTDGFTCHDRPCLNPGCDHTEYATTEHIFSDWIEIAPSTCSAQATYIRYCIDCRHSEYQDEESAIIHPHKWYYETETNPTCEEEGLYVLKCENCDFTHEDRYPAKGHDYGDYIGTADGHYSQCTRWGCKNVSETEDHIYNNNCDKDCNLCGYVRSTAHKWKDTYSHDKNYHWLVCQYCGETGEKTAHFGGEKTCTSSAKCDECGTLYGEKKEHGYRNNPEEKYKKSDATCEKAAVYYASCKDCGAKNLGETFEYGDPLGHNFSTDYSYSTETHWFECTGNGCDEKRGEESHYGGNATCENKPVCEACGKEYGKKSDHIYIETAHKDYLKSAATCEKAAVYYASCKDCGTKNLGETFEYGDPLGHDWSNTYSANDLYHWYDCSRCNAKKDESDHTGGTPTCQNKAKCDLCGREYSGYSGHSYVENHEEKYKKSDATCETPAVYYVSCRFCNSIGKETFVYGGPMGHSFSTKYSYSTEKHWFECTRSGCNEISGEEKHYGGTATCKDKPQCDACGREYGETIDHIYTETAHKDYLKSAATCEKSAVYYVSCQFCEEKGRETFEYGTPLGHDWSEDYAKSDTQHWKTCTVCGKDGEKFNHYGGNATCENKPVCEVCGKEYGKKADHIYTKTAHEDYLKSAATCEKSAVYYVSCQFCFDLGTDTFTDGTSLGHSFGSEYFSDGSAHWFECTRSGCNERSGKENHYGGTATCKDKPHCDACGKQYGEKSDHIYTKTAHEDYLKSAATCEKAAVYYAHCQFCKNLGAETFESGDPLGHSFGTQYFNDDSAHWFECTRSGCNERSGEEEHIGTIATCEIKSVCIICEKEYGDFADHDYVMQIATEEYERSAPNCEKNGVYYYSCACGAAGKNTFETNALGHIWSDDYTPAKDGSGHHKTCTRTNCTSVSETESHIGGTATCEKQAVCQACNASYGEKAPHTFNKKVADEKYLCKNATCTVAKTYYYSCVCGEKGENTFEEGSPLGHNYTVSYTYDSLYHYQACANGCGTEQENPHSMGEYYVYTPAYCYKAGEERSECSVCGYYVSREIAKTPHDMLYNQIRTEGPFRDADNVEYFVHKIVDCCSVEECDHYIVLAESIQHIHGDLPTPLLRVDPTCTEDGLTAGAVCCVPGCGTILIEQEVIPAVGHNYVNNVCENCGDILVNGSVGLAYTLSDDGTYYIVSGIGTCEDTDIIIPDTYEGKPVKEIGDNAFSNRYTLTSVTIPDSVVSIGEWAFGYCSNITNIDFGNGVVSIGDSAFYYCTALTSITIPDSVTSIGNYAFYDCFSLTSVDIGNGVTSIGRWAFDYCSALTSINVSADNTAYCSIDGNLYTKDKKTLVQYALGKANTSFTVPDGVTSIGYAAFRYSANLKSIAIPDSVTTIDSFAFDMCIGLAEITIGSGVVSIGEGAFYDCYALSTVYYNGTEADKENIDIGTKNDPLLNANWIYLVCEHIFDIREGSTYDVVLPTSCVIEGTMHVYCANRCGAYEEQLIPMSKHNFSPIVLPDTICTQGITVTQFCMSCGGHFEEYIPPQGHYYIDGVCIVCGSVKSSEGLAYTLGVDGTYYIVSGIGDCKDTEIVIPDTYEGLPVREVANNAFQKNANITKVVFGKNITTIGKSAFYRCYGLTKVVFSENLITIGNNAFEDCSAIVDVDIPNSVTTLGSSSFYRCYGLTEITIPGNISEIGAYAFAYCSGLTKAVIEFGVSSIGASAFYKSAITEVSIPNSITKIGNSAFEGCTKLISVTIPESVTSIGSSLFEGCSTLKEAYLPGSLTSTGSATFAYCYGLKKVVIPDGYTTIGYKAFMGCSGLEEIYIPIEVTLIDRYAFYSCTALSKVTYNGSIVDRESITINEDNDPLLNVAWTYLSEPVNSLEYTLSDDGTYYIVSGIGSCADTDIVIPDTYGGLPVKEIGDWAFYYCDTLTSVTIPDSVSTIKASAFEGCSSLAGVDLGNGVTSIENSAFRDCEALTSITIPDSVTSIGDYAFCECYGLTYVDIGNGVKTIGENAFAFCEAMETLVLGESLIVMGDYAFYGCISLNTLYFNAVRMDDMTESHCIFSEITSDGINLIIGADVTRIPAYLFYDYFSDSYNYEDYVPIKSVVFENGSVCTSIGDFSFNNCFDLANINLPNTIETIGMGAFGSCISLTDISLPDSVTYIGDWAFSGCESLTEITIPENVTFIGQYAFEFCTMLQEVYFNAIEVQDFYDHTYPFYCSGIDGFTVYIGSKVKRIPANMFMSGGDEQLTEVIFATGSVCESIGTNAFCGCAYLERIMLPSSIVSIEDGAFYYCIALQYINLPNRLTTIGNYAFDYCETIREVNIPNSVTYIGEAAFADCYSLEKVTISNGVSKLERALFFNCYALTDITIPKSVTVIVYEAFYNCESLSTVNYNGTQAQWNSISIGSYNESLTSAQIKFN